jgi:MtrB/PioB family decaheme-associated outer membrane protein
MKTHSRFALPLTAVSLLALAIAGVVQGAEEDSTVNDPYAPLLQESRPLATRWQSDYSGALQLGLDYTSDDSFMFGQYNGLQDKGVGLIGNLRWQDYSSSDSYWHASVSDLGLDTREGQITWGRPDKIKVVAGFDSQQQVRNDGGRTPFRGSDSALTLPDNWVTGSTTGSWPMLDESLQRFDRELSRDTFSLAVDARLNERWELQSSLSYEQREGTGDTGAAIYSDAASGDAVLLPAPVDYRTTEFELGLLYSGEKLHLDGQLGYSDFDNKDSSLSWQNPYRSFGRDYGALGQAPDNDQVRGRLTGQYLFSATARLQFDGSYAVISQDQRYLNYSVNPQLTLQQPLPRNNYGGEVAIATANTSLLFRPMRKLNMDLFFRVRERDYDTPRDGYRYPRGDAASQPAQAFTVYNTAHDYLSRTAGVEAGLQLPLRSRLTAEYAYERIERENSAVEETEEDRFTVAYRIRPWSNFTARLSLLYGNRNAGTYHWDQSYYALLDAEMINATPNSQRYINHPAMSQYHLANRERVETKADFTWQPSQPWNLSLNLHWLDDDYDKSELGLTESASGGLQLTASYMPSDTLTASLYGGFNRYEADQSSRAFRGGQEKNAFEIFPPLPQASDPARNWDLDNSSDSTTLGANVQWQASPALVFEADYSFVDTDSDQEFHNNGASDLWREDLPTVKTTLHHLNTSGTWHMREDLSLRLDYQYYRYSSDDWAWQGVQPNSIDNVLTFGARNPNEHIHYMGVSAIYRWQ